jgi:peptidoglycan/LPS O-acetylase OafA/YrhL
MGEADQQDRRLAREGKQYEPYSFSTLVEAVKKDFLTTKNQIWRLGRDSWRLADVPGFSLGTETGTRIASLDSLRGIACLVVLFHHVLVSLPGMWAVYQHQETSPFASVLGFTPLHVVWAGEEAVIIFFVLSGFVLSLPFWRGSPTPWHIFVLKRVIRLYPTYLVAITFGLIAMILISARPHGMSIWFDWYWSKGISWRLVRDHLLMLNLDSPQINIVNAPIWSLAVEMQISVIFPFLIMCMRKLGVASVPIALVLSVGSRRIGLPTPIYYLWLFVMGAELARHRDEITRFSKSISFAMQWSLLIIALLMVVWRWWGPHLGMVTTLLIDFGAAGIVIACRDFSILALLLARKNIQWLGRVSYSVYLIHFIVLYSLVCALSGNLPLWLVLSAVPVASLFVAKLLYDSVESPSIKLSKIIAQRDANAHAT